MDNVYDMRADDDGNLLNPGDVLYQVPVRTGQRIRITLILACLPRYLFLWMVDYRSVVRQQWILRLQYSNKYWLQKD